MCVHISLFVFFKRCCPALLKLWMKTICLCIYISSYLSQTRHCPSKLAARLGENTEEYLSVKEQICGWNSAEKRFDTAHMECWGGSGETTTKQAKQHIKLFVIWPFLLIIINQQLFIINPYCFTLRGFAWLAQVAQFLQTCIKHAVRAAQRAVLFHFRVIITHFLLMQLLLDFTLRWNFVCFGFSLQRFHILIQMNQIYCMTVGEKSESRSCVFIL